jgi:glyoxylase-like metal-dependent hydrolase (beta-lactamase superfamily II)
MADTLTLVPNEGWDSRILICRCGPLVDVFTVVTERYLILVDTLFGPRLAGELYAMVQPYLGQRQLIVVNSHADWDHAWGNQFFAGATKQVPAPIIGRRHCAERLLSAEADTSLQNMLAKQPERFAGTLLVPPDICFDQNLMIDGGDLTLELFATPGHQPDHCSIWIPEIRTLLAGDAAEAPFPFAQSAATLTAMRASIRAMAALDPETVLYCHAPTTAGPALLQANLHYFDTLEQHCRAALAAGAAIVPADGTDLEALIELPFEAALPFPTSEAAFYRPGHLAHIRMMLEWCGHS